MMSDHKKLNKENFFKFSVSAEKKIKHILSKYPDNRKASAVLPILDIAQRESGGWLPIKAIEEVAKYVDLAKIRVLEIASFYSMYNLKPIGKWHLQICQTTPCWLCGSEDVLKAIFDELKIKPNESTADELFTLTAVECLGACVNAPILQVNDDYYEDLDYKTTVKLLNSFKKNKPAKVGSVKGRTSEAEKGSKVLEKQRVKRHA